MLLPLAVLYYKLNQLIHYDSLQQIQSLSSPIAHSQNSADNEAIQN